MPQVPTTPENKAPAPVGKSRDLLVPPDEQFWQRYSPHHEFPLSSATSAVLHILGLGLLLLIAWILLSGEKKPNDVPKMEPVALEVGPNEKGDIRGGRGGGGNDGGGGSDKPTDKKEFVGKQIKKQYTLPDNKGALRAPVGPPKINIPTSEEGDRDLPSGEAFDELNDEAKRTVAALANRKPSGGGSPGRDGGRGGGKDRGSDKYGDKGRGYSKKKAEVERKRIQRQLRWKIIFSNVDGRDYRDQLYALGATLVIAEYERGSDGKVRVVNGQAPLVYKKVIYNLADGTVKDNQDVAKIDGIFWIDNNRETVAVLARALGISPPPPLFACFFSSRVERDLRSLEQAKSRNLREDQIYGTQFRVEKSANGPYRGIDGQRYKLVCKQVITKKQARRRGLIP
jgi:hypothetical protein